MKNKTIGIIGYCLAVISFAIMVTCRILGVELTETQILIEYLPWWIGSTVLAVSGGIMIGKSKDV